MWTPESAAKYMKQLQEQLTPENKLSKIEQIHMNMDDFLCSLLRQLNPEYKEVVEIFQTTPKWYA